MFDSTEHWDCRRIVKGTRATISKRRSEMDTTAKYIKLVMPAADRRNRQAQKIIEYSLKDTDASLWSLVLTIPILTHTHPHVAVQNHSFFVARVA